MFSHLGCVSWCGRLSLSREAQKAVAQIRGADPARRVGGGRQNVSGRYPSRKMGLIIQFESHRVELAFIYQMEHDDDALEYYDQPPAILLKYEAANGRRLGVWHTPDFFVIRRSSAGWEECKAETELKRLREKSPQRYQQEGGRWRCPPGEAYAAEFGLYYRFRSSAEINWTFQRNLQMPLRLARRKPPTNPHFSACSSARIAARTSAPGCIFGRPRRGVPEDADRSGRPVPPLEQARRARR